MYICLRIGDLRAPHRHGENHGHKIVKKKHNDEHPLHHAITLMRLAPTANLRNLRNPVAPSAKTGTFTKNSNKHAQRYCDRLTPPPLTPSKARAGGWELKLVCITPRTCSSDSAPLRPPRAGRRLHSWSRCTQCYRSYDYKLPH